MSNNDKFDISCPPIYEPIPFWGTRRAFMIHKSIDEYCENKEREMWFRRIEKSHTEKLTIEECIERYGLTEEQVKILKSKVADKSFNDKFKVGDKTVSDQLNELFCKPFKRNKID